MSYLQKSKRLPRFEPPSRARSDNMRAIRGRGNRTTEWRLRAMLVRAGVRGWIMKSPKEIGSPDFVFPRAKVVVFVDGCFWHGCPRCGHIPKTNRAYWIAKIAQNRSRDRRLRHAARACAYKTVGIWECELKRRPAVCLSRIRRAVDLATHM